MSIATRMLIAALALSLTAPLAAPARAGDAGTVTTSVRVKRIAIISPADARRQARRIADGALQACGAGDHDLAEVRGAIRHSDCYAEAMRSAGANSAPATLTAAAAPLDTGGRP